MRRQLQALGLLLLAALVVPNAALAQASPRAMLEDGGRFRTAIRSAWANATIETQTVTEAIKFGRRSDGIEIVAPEIASWITSDTSIPFSLRLLAASLGTAPLGEAFAELGYRLEERSLGFELSNDGKVGARVGGQRASVLLEPGIWRPLEYRFSDGDTQWTVTFTEYGEPGNGWIPTTIEIRRDGAVALRYRALDLARTRADLAALPSSVPPAPTLELPRLPL